MEEETVATAPVATTEPVHSERAREIFRSEVRAAFDDSLGTIVLVSPPGLKLYGMLAAVIVFIGAITLFTVRLNQSVTVDGEVVTAGGETQIEAAGPAVVSEVLVQAGAVVARGDAVVTLDSDRTSAEGTALPAILLQSIETEGRDLAHKRDLAAATASADLRQLEARKRGLVADQASLSRQFDLLVRRREMAETQVQQMQQLVDRGFGARIELNRRQEALLLALQDVESAAARREALRSQLAELEAQIEASATRGQAEVVQINGELASLAQRRAVTAADGRVTMRSPVAGQVAVLSVRAGQRVTDGAPLAIVLPNAETTEARLSVSPQAIIHFRLGQSLGLRFPAYPYQRFGVTEARVVRISGAPVRGAAAGDLQYEVVVRLKPSASPRRIELRPGMLVQAIVLTESAPLWRVLLGPLVDRRLTPAEGSAQK